MELNADQLIENAIRDGLRDGIKNKLTSGYGNPLDKLVEASIVKHGDSFRSMLEKALASCIGDLTFQEEIAGSVRAVLARTLVQRFGGELEKQVNALKSDPSTRARITIAIEEIVKQKTVV